MECIPGAGMRFVLQKLVLERGGPDTSLLMSSQASLYPHQFPPAIFLRTFFVNYLPSLNWLRPLSRALLCARRSRCSLLSMLFISILPFPHFLFPLFPGAHISSCTPSSLVIPESLYDSSIFVHEGIVAPVMLISPFI